MDKKKPVWREIVILTLIIVILGGCFYYFSHNYLVIFPIKGESMERTLHDDDKVILYKTQKVKYDDIIVFYHPKEERYLVKRVIGLVGDHIEIKYSEQDSLYHVYRNGKILSEDYINEPMDRNYKELSFTVPEGNVFILGDNRLNSLDSHLGLLAEVSNIQGVAWVRYSSWKDIKLL